MSEQSLCYRNAAALVPLPLAAREKSQQPQRIEHRERLLSSRPQTVNEFWARHQRAGQNWQLQMCARHDQSWLMQNKWNKVSDSSTLVRLIFESFSSLSNCEMCACFWTRRASFGFKTIFFILSCAWWFKVPCCCVVFGVRDDICKDHTAVISAG